MLPPRPFARGAGVRVTAAAVLAACAFGCAPRERLVLGFVPLPVQGLIAAARARDAFRGAGVEVEIRRFDAGRDALRALFAGEVDVATVFETPIVLAASAGAKPRILTRLHRASRNTVVVARGDRGIARPEDLRGRRIGVARDTNAEFVLQSLLALASIPEGAVTLVDIAPADGVGALARGDVDALSTWAPWVQRAQRALPPAAARVFASETYTEASLLVTRDDVLAARRPALMKLLRALATTEAALDRDRALAVEALERDFSQDDPADVRAAYELATPQLALDHLLLDVLDAEADWFGAHGRTAGRAPPFAQLLDPSLLEEVEPEAVTIEAER